ncbi:MAG: sugar phosphate nucleotidyltransferase [Bdellovibrionales bacterium]
MPALAHGFGINLSYIVQARQRGCHRLLRGEEFIGDSDVLLILGDNLFYGDLNFLRGNHFSTNRKDTPYSARIFGYQVEDPSRYGVVEFEKESKKVLSIEEKQILLSQTTRFPGFTSLTIRWPKRSHRLKPSRRGELEDHEP